MELIDPKGNGEERTMKMMKRSVPVINDIAGFESNYGTRLMKRLDSKIALAQTMKENYFRDRIMKHK